jgi:hypothetical protein
MPTAERASVFEGIYIGAETTPGTPVPPLKQIGDFGIELNPQIPTDPIEPYGSKVATGVVVRKEWTDGEVNGAPGFLSLPYVFSSILGAAVIETPGGATLTRRWTFTPKARRPDNIKTFTVQKGFDDFASQAAYLVFNAISMSFSNEGSTLTGSVLGQELDESDVILAGNEVALVDLDGATGGTFTLTFDGDTTSGLDWDSTADEVEAALELLDSIGSGNVSVTKPAADQFRVVFKNDLGQQNVGALTGSFGSLTGSGGGAAVSVVTAGTTVTVLDAIPISPRYPDVFVADTVAGLAANQLDRCDLFEWGVSDRFTPHFTLDSREQSYSAIVERKPTFSINLRMMHNTTSLALLDELRSGQTKIVRFLVEQDEIESGFPYRLQITMGAKMANPQRGDNNDVYSNTIELIPVPTSELSGAFMEVELDTTLTAL